MKNIHVLAPGMLTTVQDLGREGFGPMGVSPSGAADPVSLRIGNRLVGNAENTAALEMTLLGGTFSFPEGAVVALAGSDFGASLDGASVGTWSSFEVRPGQTLRLGGTKTGARCYLCVQGGIAVDLFLGSASTHLLSGLGGLEGRALRKGDTLKIGPVAQALLPVPRGIEGRPAAQALMPVPRGIEGPPVAQALLPVPGEIPQAQTGPRTISRSAEGAPRPRRVNPKALEKLAPSKMLRATPGPQSDWFDKAAQRAFYAETYRVGEQSNRMGLRLEGAAIPTPFSGEMLSEGVALGAVQITAGGAPIILFVEQQTTGGYPKIANVISADFHSLGQLRPRDEIRFELVTLETARALLVEQEQLLASENLLG